MSKETKAEKRVRLAQERALKVARGILPGTYALRRWSPQSLSAADVQQLQKFADDMHRAMWDLHYAVMDRAAERRAAKKAAR